MTKIKVAALWIAGFIAIAWLVGFFDSRLVKDFLESRVFDNLAKSASLILVLASIVNKLQKSKQVKSNTNPIGRFQSLSDLISGGLAYPCLLVFRDAWLAFLGCDVPMKSIGSLQYITCGLISFWILTYAFQEGLTSIKEYHGLDKSIKAEEITTPKEVLHQLWLVE